jgi:hypothetical protein
MMILEAIAIGLLLFFGALGLLFARREYFVRRGGMFELYLRLGTLVEGRGWAPGFALFVGDEVRWYRMFSFSPRPRRVLKRSELQVAARRSPNVSEQVVVPPDWVILRCMPQPGRTGMLVEIAMSPLAATGFLSWLESAPPGAAVT